MRIIDWSSDVCSSDLAPTNSSIRMAVPAARKALTPGRENARCPPYSDRRAHDRWPAARRRLRTADIRTVRPAGVGGMTYMSSEELTARLVECGYCIVPAVLPTETIAEFKANPAPT